MIWDFTSSLHWVIDTRYWVKTQLNAYYNIYEQNNNLHFLYIFFVLSKQLILRYLINLRNLKNAAGMWVSPGMAVFSIRWHATIKFVSHYKWNEVKDYNLFSFLIIPPTTSHQIMNVIFHFVLKDLI